MSIGQGIGIGLSQLLGGATKQRGANQDLLQQLFAGGFRKKEGEGETGLPGQGGGVQEFLSQLLAPPSVDLNQFEKPAPPPESFTLSPGQQRFTGTEKVAEVAPLPTSQATKGFQTVEFDGKLKVLNKDTGDLEDVDQAAPEEEAVGKMFFDNGLAMIQQPNGTIEVAGRIIKGDAGTGAADRIVPFSGVDPQLADAEQAFENIRTIGATLEQSGEFNLTDEDIEQLKADLQTAVTAFKTINDPQQIQARMDEMAKIAEQIPENQPGLFKIISDIIADGIEQLGQVNTQSSLPVEQRRQGL